MPILVRRSSSDGRYEVIYGRRRLKACRELGLKVRANVEDLDDASALLAKGLENAARRNLSFYEKARFAAVIQVAGHNTKTVRQVLSLSAPGLSHLTKVTENVPDDVGDAIGAAQKSGRPKWILISHQMIAWSGSWQRSPDVVHAQKRAGRSRPHQALRSNPAVLPSPSPSKRPARMPPSGLGSTAISKTSSPNPIRSLQL